MGEFFVFSAFLWKYIEENWMRYFMWRFVKIDRLNLYGKVVVKFDMGARGGGNWQEEEDWEVQNLAWINKKASKWYSSNKRSEIPSNRSIKASKEEKLCWGEPKAPSRGSFEYFSWAFFVFSCLNLLITLRIEKKMETRRC